MEELNEIEQEINNIALQPEEPGEDEINKLLEEFPEFEPSLAPLQPEEAPELVVEDIRHHKVLHNHCESCGQCLIVGDGEGGFWHRCTGDSIDYRRTALVFNSFKPKRK